MKTFVLLVALAALTLFGFSAEKASAWTPYLTDQGVPEINTTEGPGTAMIAERGDSVWNGCRAIRSSLQMSTRVGVSQVQACVNTVATTVAAKSETSFETALAAINDVSKGDVVVFPGRPAVLLIEELKKKIETLQNAPTTVVNDPSALAEIAALRAQIDELQNELYTAQVEGNEALREQARLQASLDNLNASSAGDSIVSRGEKSLALDNPHTWFRSPSEWGDYQWVIAGAAGLLLIFLLITLGYVPGRKAERVAKAATEVVNAKLRTVEKDYNVAVVAIATDSEKLASLQKELRAAHERVESLERDIMAKSEPKVGSNVGFEFEGQVIQMRLVSIVLEKGVPRRHFENLYGAGHKSVAEENVKKHIKTCYQEQRNVRYGGLGEDVRPGEAA